MNVLPHVSEEKKTRGCWASFSRFIRGKASERIDRNAVSHDGFQCAYAVAPRVLSARGSRHIASNGNGVAEQMACT